VAAVAAPEVEESETMGAAAEVRVPDVERGADAARKQRWRGTPVASEAEEARRASARRRARAVGACS
jgi:hypothetical protein